MHITRINKACRHKFLLLTVIIFFENKATHSRGERFFEGTTRASFSYLTYLPHV